MIKKLNLGCAFNKIDGFINIDKSRKSYADKIIDLEKPRCLKEFKDNSIEEIVSIHILEHIKNIIPLMNECYRVLKKGGKMLIIVPIGEGMFADPTHCRFFSKLSFRYYCNYPLSEIYGIKTHFKEIGNKFIDNEDGGVLNVILEK
jgi:predicted SAM-dependent methyltransferase